MYSTLLCAEFNNMHQECKGEQIFKKCSILRSKCCHSNLHFQTTKNKSFFFLEIRFPEYFKYTNKKNIHTTNNILKRSWKLLENYSCKMFCLREENTEKKLKAIGTQIMLDVGIHGVSASTVHKNVHITRILIISLLNSLSFFVIFSSWIMINCMHFISI